MATNQVAGEIPRRSDWRMARHTCGPLEVSTLSASAAASTPSAAHDTKPVATAPAASSSSRPNSRRSKTTVHTPGTRAATDTSHTTGRPCHNPYANQAAALVTALTAATGDTPAVTPVRHNRAGWGSSRTRKIADAASETAVANGMAAGRYPVLGPMRGAPLRPIVLLLVLLLFKIARSGHTVVMPRAIWSGSISFGLVNIPVKLYNAVTRKSVSFNQIDRRTGARMRYRKVSAADETEVPNEEFVDLAEIDPIYYDAAYYLAPDKATVKPYALLAEAMERTQKVGIARFV